MIKLKHLFFITATIAAISLQGCSSGKKHHTPGTNPEPGTTFELSGKASKGLVIGGVVKVHPIINGDFDASQVLATTTTGSSGEYSMSMPESWKNQPVVVRVTASGSGTTIRCDLPNGCGEGIAFGDNAPIAGDSGFKLDAVVSQPNESRPVYITVLSNIASEVVYDALSMSSGASVVDTISNSYSQVANRFGVIGNLNEMPVVDLTNSQEVAAALNSGRTDSVQFASLNSAIVQAVLNDGATSISQAISSFSGAFTSTGLAGNTSDDAQTGLDEILASVRDIISTVQTRSEGTIDLSSLDAEIATEQAFAANEEPDRFDPGTPSENVNKTDLEIVKAMVSDIRDLTLTIGDSSLGGDSTVSSVSDTFAIQLEAAEMATSVDAMASVQALSMSVSAISEAYSAYQEDSELTSFMAINGLTVSVSSENDVSVFTVDEAVAVIENDMDYSVSVNLVAILDVDYDDQSSDSVTAVAGDAEFNILGSASTSAIKMTIKDGSSVTISALDVMMEEDELTSEEEQTHSLDMFSFLLDLELAQLQSANVPDPITVNGKFAVSVTDVAVDLSETDDAGDFELNVATVSLQFSGYAANTSGEKYRFAFSANGDASGVTLNEVWNTDGSTVTAETESNYAALSLSIQFSADLVGQLDAVALRIGATRSGLDDASVAINVIYPGKKLVLETKIVDGESDSMITARNQDGVILTVMEGAVDGQDEWRVSGNIKLNGVQYATIAEGANGVVTITYSDDSFESL